MAEIDDEIAELRARLSALEAKRAGDSEPPAVPPPPVPQAQSLSAENLSSGAKAAIMMVATVVIAIVIALASRPTPSTEKAAADLVTPPAAAPSEAAAETAVASADPWTYSEVEDPMSDAKGKIACTIASNQVRLDFPYGEVGGQLCVRRSPRHGLDVFVTLLGDGQILCHSYENCTVNIRYDEAPSRAKSAIGPADNSSNAVFLRGEAGMVAELKAAKRFRIELPFYEAGNQTLEFDVAGLKWD